MMTNILEKGIYIVIITLPNFDRQQWLLKLGE